MNWYYVIYFLIFFKVPLLRFYENILSISLQLWRNLQSTKIKKHVPAKVSAQFPSKTTWHQSKSRFNCILSNKVSPRLLTPLPIRLIIPRALINWFTWFKRSSSSSLLTNWILYTKVWMKIYGSTTKIKILTLLNNRWKWIFSLFRDLGGLNCSFRFSVGEFK